MDSKLEGRVAVVTGGASGLGRASAERFAAEGADLVLADLNARAGEETAAAITAETGRQVEFVALDVSDEDQTEALMRHTVDAFGRLDVVLAAAGVSSAGYISGQVTVRIDDPETNYLINKPAADWRRVLDINLTGVMLTARAAAQAMIGLGNPGSIISIASVAGRVPLPGAAEYCVSKAGVIMLTQVLARELADHGIRGERHRAGLHRNTHDGGHPPGPRRPGNGDGDDAHAALWPAFGNCQHGAVLGQRRVLLFHWPDALSERGG